MSQQIDDGGSAFPVPPPIAETDGVSMQWSRAEPGMSLRDWFAGQALAGTMASPDCPSAIQPIAESAYKIADAMIAARKGGAE